MMDIIIMPSTILSKYTNELQEGSSKYNPLFLSTSQEASAWCLLIQRGSFLQTLLVLVLNDLLFGELTLLRLCFILGICNQ